MDYNFSEIVSALFLISRKKFGQKMLEMPVLHRTLTEENLN